MASLLVRRWYVTMPIVGVTLLVALSLQRNLPPSYTASGTIQLASPEIDPTRSVLHSVDLAALLDEAGSDEVRQEVVAAGGTEQYTVVPVGTRRIQVLVDDELRVATLTGETVLRHLGRFVDREQARTDRDPDEWVGTRLLLDVPSVSAPAASGDTPVRAQVTGTLVLRDPLLDPMNPFGVAQSSRLLIAAVASDAGRERITASMGEATAYEVRPFDRDSPGLLQLGVRSPDPDTTLAAFDVLVRELATEVERREVTADVPLSQRRIIEVLAAPQQAEERPAPISPLAVLVALAGLAIAIGIAALLDRRKAQPNHDGPDRHDRLGRLGAPEGSPWTS